jgi:hypothetical protein
MRKARVAEDDPQAFDQLFGSESSNPTDNEAVEWLELYTRLTTATVATLSVAVGM